MSCHESFSEARRAEQSEEALRRSEERQKEEKGRELTSKEKDELLKEVYKTTEEDQRWGGDF